MVRVRRLRAYEDAMFVRLFRLWAVGREEQRSVIPVMHEEACKLGYKESAALACASLFELVEGRMGRKLKPEDGSSPKFSEDERGLIDLVRTAPSLMEEEGMRPVPDGISAAIRLAASCVCDAMGIVANPTDATFDRTAHYLQGASPATITNAEHARGL